MSNAVGMAMAHAIPVVAFDLSGNRALLEPDCLVSMGEYGAMAERVGQLRMSRSAREKIGMRLQARARELFSLRAMVNAWEELLTRRKPGPKQGMISSPIRDDGLRN
jgi:glycosyltransferase involved in cell wall biosynthesis